MNDGPPTPRRLPLPSVTTEANGNGEHDHRGDPPPKDVYEAALRSYNATLELWERFGAVAREVSEARSETRELRREVRAVVARLDHAALTAGHAPLPPLPPMRDRAISEADLDAVLDDREIKRLGKRVRGIRENVADGLVKGLVGLVFAAITAAVGIWWGQTHPVQTPPPVTSPAPQRTP